MKVGNVLICSEMEVAAVDPGLELEVIFFHDVLCAWCYAVTPRLERLAGDLAQEGVAVRIEHRSFALAPEAADLERMFGSQQAAKREILNHWRAANANDDEHRIRADLMAERAFPYPYSTPGLLACQAAAILEGNEGHRRYFARVQRAHLTECLDINDREVLLACAEEAGFDRGAFTRAMESDEARRRLEVDLALARDWGITGVPSMVLDRRWLVVGAHPYDRLKAAFQQVLAERNGGQAVAAADPEAGGERR